MKQRLPNSRAICIPFHRYVPHAGTGYKFLFNNLLTTLPLWADEFDRLYLIDSDMDFSEDDIRSIKRVKENTAVWKKELDGNHWVQFKWIIPKIEEENILFMDHDVVVNKKGIIDSWFQAIENGYDFVGSFDGSGGMIEQIHNTFPFMKENNFSRMGSYYFILSKKLLDKIPAYDFAPVTFENPTDVRELNCIASPGDWFDSFGLFTVKMLATNPKIKVIEDPRHSIYLQPSDTKEDWWDINKDPEAPNNLGYYHIRNGNLANYVLSSKLSGHTQDYQRELKSNPRELLRSLAWFYYLSDYDGTPLIELLKDMGVKYKLFLEYYDEFTKYHGLE